MVGNSHPDTSPQLRYITWRPFLGHIAHMATKKHVCWVSPTIGDLPKQETAWLVSLWFPFKPPPKRIPSQKSNPVHSTTMTPTFNGNELECPKPTGAFLRALQVPQHSNEIPELTSWIGPRRSELFAKMVQAPNSD